MNGFTCKSDFRPYLFLVEVSTLIPGENVVTLFLTSGVVTFTSPNPECSHVFYMCTRFQMYVS